jgi:hypothetical protein
MAEKVIAFSDQEQMTIEAIVIDRDGEEALRLLGDFVGKFKAHASHACGPKAAEGPPGHG